MIDIDSLWRSRLRVLLTNLAERQQEYREIGNVAAQVTADYHGRFLIELLQNASDQAVGIKDASVLIVWTRELVAIANQGAPFSSQGLEAITSIALSPKKPDESIGNKGIGFKSVFEITRAPEIYSEVIGDVGAGYRQPVNWCLHRAPFEQPGSLERALKIVHTILSQDLALKQALQRRFGEKLRTPVQRALEQSAPFKYPIGLSEDHRQHRMGELGFTPEEQHRYRTLVVLPLRPGADVVVGHALQELLDPNNALMTFLPGITSLSVRAAPAATKLETRLWREDRPLVSSGLTSLLERITCCETRIEPEPQNRRGARPNPYPDPVQEFATGTSLRRWWVLERTIGALPSEADALREAAKYLPGDHWKEIRQVPLSIAMPQPHQETLALEPDGRFVVGLPTLVKTGSPLWINSHFHATLSRTGLDLENPFNRLLFSKALKLVKQLIEFLKHHEDTSRAIPLERLAVALIFLKSEGALADALNQPGGPSDGTVVLAADGRTFLRGTEVRIPAKEDVDIFLRFEPTASDPLLSLIGYRLSHPALLQHHHTLLKQLGAKVAIADNRRPLCVERVNGTALIEHWARRIRGKGPALWEPFLRWILRRFREEDLEYLNILPTGTNDLSAPGKGVFLSLSDKPASQDEPVAAEVPAEVQDLLSLFDTRAYPCRTGDGGLTAIGMRLTGNLPDRYSFGYDSAATALKLLHRPTFQSLLENALPRALEQAVAREDASSAWPLLKTGLTWLTRKGNAQDASSLRLLLPSAAGRWRPATELALGPGWLNDDEQGRTLDSLLSAIYTDDRRTCSWTTFQRYIGSEDSERERLRTTLLTTGVVARPRMISLPPVTTLIRDDAGIYVPVGECPIPGLDPQWREYQQTLARYPRYANRGDRFVVTPLWVDGLEHPYIAPSVSQWLLPHPEGYSTSTELRREGETWGGTTVNSWWLHAMRSMDLALFPTPSESWSKGVCLRASEVCILSEEERGKPSLRLLPHIPADMKESIPRALGVVALKEGDVTWLTSRLNRLALLWRIAPFADLHHVEALVMALYERIDAKVSRSSASPLLDAHLPAWRGERLGTMRLQDEPILYLEDDPYPTCYIPEYQESAHLRLPRGMDLNTLFTQLQTLLGVSKILRTSMAPLHVPFWPELEPDCGVLSWLETHCRCSSLSHHLAVVLVHGRGSVGEIKAHHRAAWARLQQTKLLFGQFPDDAQAFFDARHQVLYASSALIDSPFALLSECWQVVGNIWEEAWLVATSHLARSEEHLLRYFRGKRIGAGEYEQVRLAFQLEPTTSAASANAPSHAMSPEQPPVVDPNFPGKLSGSRALAQIPLTGTTGSDRPGSVSLKSGSSLQIAGRRFEPLQAANALAKGRDGEFGQLLQQHLVAPSVLDLLASLSNRIETATSSSPASVVVGESNPSPGRASLPHKIQCAPDATISGASHPLLHQSVTMTQAKYPATLVTPDAPPDGSEGAGGMLLGVLGEAFVFEQLKQWLPGFDATCWISPLRQDFGLPGPTEADAGCDFRYRDVAGILTGTAGTECWIEVKACRGPLDPWVRLSRNEWETARICHQTPERCYVLLRVAELATVPRIADILRDPFGHYRAGTWRLHLKEAWLRAVATSSHGTQNASHDRAMSTHENTQKDFCNQASTPLVPSDQSHLFGESLTTAHTGTHLQYTWTSRQGYHYTENCWSCCGQKLFVRDCTRVPGRYHPGELAGGGSRRGGGNGSGKWTCCWEKTTAPGCQDEGADSAIG